MMDVSKLKSSLVHFRSVAHTMDPPDEGIVQVCDRTLDALALADERC